MEIVSNTAAVAKVKDYHATKRAELHKFFDADEKTRKTMNIGLEGVQVAFLEHTAWDLALANASLGYVDSDLGFALSHIYITQTNLWDLTRGMTQAMYNNPPALGGPTFLGAVSVYYDDAVLLEPRLLQMYDDALQRIDKTLGESSH